MVQTGNEIENRVKYDKDSCRISDYALGMVGRDVEEDDLYPVQWKQNFQQATLVLLWMEMKANLVGTDDLNGNPDLEELEIFLAMVDRSQVIATRHHILKIK